MVWVPFFARLGAPRVEKQTTKEASTEYVGRERLPCNPYKELQSAGGLDTVRSVVVTLEAVAL
jgi:hypothetical protein